MAKRGDLVVIRTESVPLTGDDFPEITYRLFTATSCTKDGSVKTLRSIESADAPTVAVAKLGAHMSAVVPAGKFHVTEAIYSIMSAGHGAPTYALANDVIKDLEGWHMSDPSALADVHAMAGEDVAARVRADQCGHTVEQDGCGKLRCEGVPPVSLVLDQDRTRVPEQDPGAGKEWQDCHQFGRRLGLEARNLFKDQAASMPDYACSAHYNRPRVRLAYEYHLTPAGHDIRVIFYRDRFGLEYRAIMCDGETVARGIAPGKSAYATLLQVIMWLEERNPSPVSETAGDVLTELLDSAGTESGETESAPASVFPAFTVPLADFKAALAHAVSAIPTRPSVPVLGGVMITAEPGKITVWGFNYEIAAPAWIDASDVTAGRVLVSGHGLNDIVKVMDGTSVTVTGSGANIQLTNGRTRYTLPTMPAEDYPTIPPLPDIAGTVDIAPFAAMIVKAALSAGTDQTLPMMTGIRLEPGTTALAVCSTDRYRLSAGDLRWIPAAGTCAPMLIPARTLATVAKTFAAQFKDTNAKVIIGYNDYDAEVSSATASFTCGRFTLITRLLDGHSYPPVMSLFADKYPLIGLVDKKQLAAAVKRVAVTLEKAMPVRLTWSPDGTVTVEAGGEYCATASETVPCTYNGTVPVTIGFDPSYLPDGLATVDGDTAQFAMQDNQGKPAVISTPGAEDTDFRYLIMPIRIGVAEKPAPDAPVPAPAPEGTEDMPQDTPVSDAAPAVETAEPAATPVVPEEPAATPVVPGEPAAGATPDTDTITQAELIAEEAFSAWQAGNLEDALAHVERGEAEYPAYLVARKWQWNDIRDLVNATDQGAPAGTDFEEPAPVAAPLVTSADAPRWHVIATHVDIAGPAETVTADVQPETVPAKPATALAGDSDLDLVHGILSRATWSTEHMKVRGAGRVMVHMMRLNEEGFMGRPLFQKVAAVCESLRGHYERKPIMAFVFAVPEQVWPTGELSSSGQDRLTAWLTANAPGADDATVTVVEAVAPVPVGDSVPDAVPAVEDAAPVDVPEPAEEITVPDTLETLSDSVPLTDDETLALAEARRAAFAKMTPVPASAVPARPVTVGATMAYRFAKWAPGTPSYTESRAAIKVALRAAGIVATVARDHDSDRCAFMVTVADGADMARSDMIVREIAELESTVSA